LVCFSFWRDRVLFAHRRYATVGESPQPRPREFRIAIRL